MPIFPKMSRIAIRTLARDVALAGVAGAGADAICQHFEAHIDSKKDADKDFELSRNLAFAAFGGVYIGGVCGRIYSLYPRIAQKMFGKNLTPKLEGVVSSCLDNFLHVPFLYIPSFYMCTGILRGEGIEATVQTLRSSWAETVFSCCAFWIPAQYVIFSKVPAAWRVRAVASGDFVWNVVLSYIAHREPAENLPSIPDVVASGSAVVTTVSGTLGAAIPIVEACEPR